MQLSYDPSVNIAYIRLKKKTGKVRTVRVSDYLNVDVATDGSIYGIELLNANEQLRENKSKYFRLVNEVSGESAELAIGASSRSLFLPWQHSKNASSKSSDPALTTRLLPVARNPSDA